LVLAVVLQASCGDFIEAVYAVNGFLILHTHGILAE
jgi:hypothetical protein